MAQYLLSLIDDESWHDSPDADFEAEMHLHADFSAAVEAAGCQITGGAALERQSTATTVHRDGDRIRVTDGPFVEAKEVIGGFYLIEAPDLDTVLALAKICPSAHVEVRPVMDTSDYE